MKIIKLDATESTNTFLKELCHKNTVENFTVVLTDNQTNGRGQMNAVWESESGKNLTFSILVQFFDLNIDKQFYISKVISLAIYEVLTTSFDANISIKWPNDILAGHLKLCGVLIENSVKKAKIIKSIVGIGLNVNQKVFESLPNATSMRLISGSKFDLSFLLHKIVVALKKQVKLLDEKKFNKIDDLYLSKLYKYKTPSMFKDTSGMFMGKIIGVSSEGRLQVEMNNEAIKEFNFKEIEFVNG